MVECSTDPEQTGTWRLFKRKPVKTYPPAKRTKRDLEPSNGFSSVKLETEHEVINENLSIKHELDHVGCDKDLFVKPKSEKVDCEENWSIKSQLEEFGYEENSRIKPELEKVECDQNWSIKPEPVTEEEDPLGQPSLNLEESSRIFEEDTPGDFSTVGWRPEDIHAFSKR